MDKLFDGVRRWGWQVRANWARRAEVFARLGGAQSAELMHLQLVSMALAVVVAVLSLGVFLVLWPMRASLDLMRTAWMAAGMVLLVALSLAFITRQFMALHMREVRRRERAEQLGEISQLFASALDAQYTLDRALAQLERVIHCDYATIGLVEGVRARFSAVRGLPDSPQVHESFLLDDLPLFAWLCHEERPLLIVDTMQHPLWRPQLFGGGISGIASWVGAPMIAQGQVLGVVMAGSRQIGGFSEEDLSALVVFAGHLATALENARLYKAQRQRREELAAIQRIAAQVSAESAGRADLLDHIVAEVARVLGMPVVLLLVWDAPQRNLIIGAQRGVSPAYAATQMYPGGVTLARLQTDGSGEFHPAYLSNLATQGLGDRDLAQQEGLTAELIMPLVAVGRLLGLLCLEQRVDAARHFTERDHDILSLFAVQAAAALQGEALRAAEQVRAEEAMALLELSQTLVASLALDSVQTQVLTLTEQLTNALACWIQLYDAAQGVLTRVAMQATVAVPFELGESLGRAVFIAGQAQYVSDLGRLEASAARSAAADAGVRSALFLPLRVHDEVLGVLGLYFGATELSQARLDLLSVFANLMAAAIANAHLYERVQDYAWDLESMVVARTAELRQQKEYSEATLRGVADAVLVLEPGNILHSANLAADTLLNSLRPVEQKALSALIERIGHAAHETQAIALGGHDWEVRADYLHPHRSDTGIVAVLHDVTRLLELDRLKSQFVTNVSHELRTPLTNIRMYVGLLKHGAPEKRTQYFEVLERETARLTRLIQNLLDLSRLEAGGVRVERQFLDLNQVAQEGVVGMDALAQSRAIVLTADLAPEPVVVGADRGLLDQALINLLGNALNYTPEGGRVSVRVRAELIDDVLCAVLAVVDSGPGIPAAEREHIFERFFRGSASAAAHTAGTGLGLAIVAEVVRLHGGHVAVESVDGAGCTFRLVLPQIRESSKL